MIAWLALAAALLALVPWIALGVTVPRFWRRVEPQVRPLLAMFGPPPSGLGAGDVHGTRAESSTEQSPSSS